MKQPMDEIISVALIVSLLALFAGIASAEPEISVLGAINEDGQLLGENGVIYEIAENDIGIDLMELVGHKVDVEATLMVSEEVLMITVLNFTLRD